MELTAEFIKYKIEETRNKLIEKTLNEKINLFQRVDLPLITIHLKREPEKVSRKKLRLYLELINDWYPLYSRSTNDEKAKFILEIFKCQCTERDLDTLHIFKDITKKEVITMRNEKPKIISRLRWRSRENLIKNIIHFQQ